MKNTLRKSAMGVLIANSVFTMGIAQAGVTGNISAASNYIWRGVTQTSDQSAVSGGIDYTSEQGIYAGGWLSNAVGAYELDLYGGYTGEVDLGNLEGVNYDLGAIYYAYPASDNADFLEIFATGGYGPLSTGLYINIYADDAAFEGETPNFYIPVSFDFDLNILSGLSGSVYGGYFIFDAKGADDYLHIGLSLSKEVEGMGDFTLAVDKNDLDGGNLDDPRVMVSWSKEFDL